MSQRNRERGKEAENGIAEFLGWMRIGTMGREDLRSPDDKFSGESKSTAACVVFGWMDQAEKNNQKRKKPRKPGIPVVIVHKRGTHHKNDLACVRLSDFKDLIEKTQISASFSKHDAIRIFEDISEDIAKRMATVLYNTPINNQQGG